MTTSEAGVNLIKKFEGLKLEAYKPVSTEKYWTIGYGHYGVGVLADMRITEAEASAFLKTDLRFAECCVNSLPYSFTQNQFDALVSFTFNCGKGNLINLTKNGQRTKTEIAEKIVLYNKAGGKVLKGLQRRREEEQKMFRGEV